MDQVRKKKKKGIEDQRYAKKKKNSCAHRSVLHSSPMNVVRVGVTTSSCFFGFCK